MKKNYYKCYKCLKKEWITFPWKTNPEYGTCCVCWERWKIGATIIPHKVFIDNYNRWKYKNWSTI